MARGRLPPCPAPTMNLRAREISPRHPRGSRGSGGGPPEPRRAEPAQRAGRANPATGGMSREQGKAMVRFWPVPSSLQEPGHDLSSLRLGGILALPVAAPPRRGLVRASGLLRHSEFDIRHSAVPPGGPSDPRESIARRDGLALFLTSYFVSLPYEASARSRVNLRFSRAPHPTTCPTKLLSEVGSRQPSRPSSGRALGLRGEH